MATLRSKQLLTPDERVAEVLFGLIMVLTFTCSFSVATGDQTTTRELVIAALGCNFAWGLIDAIFYLMTSFSERGRNILALERLRMTRNADEARALVADAFPPLIASVLTPAEFERIRGALAAMVDVPEHPYLTKNDWLAALGVFLLVFLSTLPVVVPLWLIPDVKLALRVSNAVAVVMLFIAGYAFGRYAMRRLWWATGLAMVALGVVLVAITIRLGG
jgi:VIT1/CCC1 family predicted Fe2+/Mn2+ transporter